MDESLTDADETYVDWIDGLLQTPPLNALPPPSSSASSASSLTVAADVLLDEHRTTTSGVRRRLVVVPGGDVPHASRMRLSSVFVVDLLLTTRFVRGTLVTIALPQIIITDAISAKLHLRNKRTDEQTDKRT